MLLWAAPACLTLDAAGAVPVLFLGGRLPDGRVFAHVVFAGFQLGGVVYDPVHDGVGVCMCSIGC